MRLRLALVLLAAVLSTAASCGGPRRVAKVSVATAHATLASVQDASRLMRCPDAATTAPVTGAPMPMPIVIDPRVQLALDALRERIDWLGSRLTRLETMEPTTAAKGACLTPDEFRALSARLVMAFDADIRVTSLVKAMPMGAPQSPEVARLLSEIASIIADVVGSMPDTAARAALVENLRPAR